MARNKKSKNKETRQARAKEREERKAKSFIELAAKPIVQALPEGDLPPMSDMGREIALKVAPMERIEQIRRM